MRCSKSGDGEMRILTTLAVVTGGLLVACVAFTGFLALGGLLAFG